MWDLSKKFILSYFSHYRGISANGWINIFAALINSGASVAILFLSLYLAKRFHYSTISIGWVVTAYGIGAMFGALGGGVLCDYLSSQLVCIYTLFINALTLLIIPYLDNYYVIMFSVFLMGMSNYAFSPANRISIMNESPSNQMRMSSLRYMMVNLGIGAYVFMGGRIVSIGYNWLFMFNGLIILLTGIMLLVTYNKFHKQTVTPAAQEIVTKQSNNKLIFFYLYTGLLLIAFIFSQLRITYPLYLHHQYQLSEQLFSNIFLVNTLLIVVLQVPIINFLSRINTILSSGLGALLIGCGVGFTYFGTGYSFLILLCVVWTLGEILFFSTLQTLIFEKAMPEQKGKYMGIAQMTAAFANIIGPVTGSWLYGFADTQYLWFCCIAFGIVALLIHFRVYLEEVNDRKAELKYADKSVFH